MNPEHTELTLKYLNLSNDQYCILASSIFDTTLFDKNNEELDWKIKNIFDFPISPPISLNPGQSKEIIYPYNVEENEGSKIPAYWAYNVELYDCNEVKQHPNLPLVEVAPWASYILTDREDVPPGKIRISGAKRKVLLEERF